MSLRPNSPPPLVGGVRGEGGIADTTGAGDAFQGGFVYGILQGWTVEKSAVLANACGYLKSRNVGALNMPKREIVEGFLKKEKGWDNLE